MRRYWTDKEVDDLVRLYPDNSTEYLMQYFNRNSNMIYNKAYLLGLNKSHKYLSELAKKISATNCNIESRFKKGLVPWNKGKKCPEIAIKSKATQFKKGSIPHNARPDGYIGIRKDKSGKVYQMIKVPGRRTMIMLHRHIWEQENGPIPKCKIVRFKDGNTMNCCIENLELVSRKQHMKKNTFMNLPDDLRKVLQARRVLSRYINQKSKNNE